MAKFEDFVTKARARASKNGSREPYTFEVEGETFEINFPDAQAYLELSTLDEDETLAQLKVIFRSNPAAFNALMRALKGEPAEVIDVILTDMFSVWNDDSVSQPGKSKA